MFVGEKYEIMKLDVSKLCELFLQKFDSNLTYSVEKICIDSIKPTSLYLQVERLLYAIETAALLKAHGFSLYEPHIKKSHDKRRIVPPPIIEVRGDDYVLCDGTHRITAARKRNENSVIVLVVRGMYRPLAGDITSWDEITVTNMRYRSKDNFVNFNEAGMTGYSKFCNSINMENGGIYDEKGL